MTMRSPEELGAAFTQNILGGYLQGKELAGIDAILKEANASQDPNAMNNALTNILANVSDANRQRVVDIISARKNLKPKMALTLNEQLNQLKSRTKQTVDQILLPFSKKDAFGNLVEFDFKNEKATQALARAQDIVNRSRQIEAGLFQQYGMQPPGDILADILPQQNVNIQPNTQQPTSENTQTTEFKIGQEFDKLPENAPEGAILKQGKITWVRRNGKWIQKK